MAFIFGSSVDSSKDAIDDFGFHGIQGRHFRLSLLGLSLIVGLQIWIVRGTPCWMAALAQLLNKAFILRLASGLTAGILR